MKRKTISKRTIEEINRQIEGLTKMKETLPEINFFGTNNWEAIDVQIEVLKGKTDPDDLYKDELEDDYQDGDNELYLEAEKAERWLDGEVKEDLFDEE